MIQPNIHIHANQNATVKLFLLNSKGKHVKWTGVGTAELRGSRVSFAKRNNGFAMVLWGQELAGCREELCNTFYHFMRHVKLPMGTEVTLEPPRTKTGRSIVRDLSTFSAEIGGSEDGRYRLWDSTQTSMIAAKKRGYLLTNDSTGREEAYGIMDVLMGTGALLMGGPGSYSRPLRGKNNLNCGTRTVQRNYVTRVYNPATQTHTRETHTTRVSSGLLKYTGVTNFWLGHPAQFSVITGLFRTALDLWFEGKYDEINDEIGIDGCRRWLTEMSQKKKHTAADKKELVELLSWFKPYLFSKKVDENPGGYPVNRYTYSMFLKFANKTFPAKFMPTWRAQGGNYGLGAYGFVAWCRKQAWQPSSFKKAQRMGNWGGLSGQRVSFGGHY